MAEEPTSTLTKKDISTANKESTKPTKATSTVLARQSKLMARLGHLLTGVSALGASLLAGSTLDLAQLMENQAVSTFFQLRGPVTPPEDIVILAIDDQSISTPKQYYQIDPQQYAFLEPLKAFPFKREAYAQIIDKLMQAGARSVALDVVFDTPSSYGLTDDRKLQQSLQRHGSRVTLAALYESFETREGFTTQLKQPSLMFRTNSVSIGSVNFPKEVDGKIHRFASVYPKLLAQNEGFEPSDKLPSFDEAVMAAANFKYPHSLGDRIYFYGPADTFKTYPLWHVIDPENWNTYLQQGKVFKDKIVIIGATDKLSNDYHPVAASSSWLYPEQMSGVEIHANAIATLMQGKAIASGINSPPLRGLFVLALVGGSGLLVSRSKRGINRFIFCIAIATTWAGISYATFFYAQLILPTAIPVQAICAIGLFYLGTEVAREMLRKSQLLGIFQKYPSSRVVQDIIREQDDLKDLLQSGEVATSGKILDGRYQIVQVLGAGGFSETYIALDTKRPGNPRCVVKQLKLANNNKKSEQLEIARRFFNSEAKIQEKLGKHNQIPQLLAYFEEDEEFYLVQEYIVGPPLSQELPSGKRISETAVIQILRDLLQTLAFVHENGVIHRDIKPSNIIRRLSDRKLVLIDFGAVKEVTLQVLESQKQSTSETDTQEQSAFTIGIGTRGYAPREQCFGRPQYSSDIYAIGMIGIKALTGIPTHEIERNDDGELKWMHKAQVSHALAEILCKMVEDSFKQRYKSASEALEALDKLVTYQDINPLPKNNFSIDRLSDENSDSPTTPWLVSEDTEEAVSSTSILPKSYD